MNDELLLVDKPKGITSFDVIRILRKELHIKKMGHAGTLDPLASGLMLIGVGPGTKKMTELVGLSKRYEVEVLLGTKTTTGDMEGEILESEHISTIDREIVLSVLHDLIGVQELHVPAYSAIKQGGEALYKKARRGEVVDVPIKKMDLLKLKLTNIIIANGEVILCITMDVSSGTYVRSVTEEIGKRLGVPATTKELRRVRIGKFNIKNARTIDTSSFRKNI